MEVRSGQEGMHTGFNNLSRPNEESSSKLSAAASIATTVTDRRRNESSRGCTVLNPLQTLDHHHLNNLPHQHQQHTHVHHTNSNPDPDPDPAPPVPLAASDAKIVTAPSNSKPPPPQPSPSLVPTSATATATASVQYRECLKNHAASTGGHVVDGCGEFMPSGEENTPEALRCAACDCHRNFHRREVEVEGEETTTPQIQSGNNNHSQYPYNSPNRNTATTTARRITTTHHLPQVVPPAPPPPPQQRHNTVRHSQGQIHPPVMMAFHGGAPAESSSEDLHMFNYSINAGGTTTIAQAGKKRFRTKFSQGQKEKMEEFAERLGWKIQKQDDEQVDQFCGEVGVKRQVFKVWMHNNKAAANKKKQQL